MSVTGRRVLIVDFSSDARAVSCGRSIALVLPDGPDIGIVRGTAGRPWADEAIAGGAHVILSGSDIPAPREESWFAPACGEIRRIIDAGLPMLGVCFGHQVIVQALGDPDMVRPAALAEYGIARIRPLGDAARDPVFGALGASEYPLYNAHFDEVAPERAVTALGLDVLAESDRCAVHAYRLRGRPVWGIQSHPEMTAEVVKRCLDEPEAKAMFEEAERARAAHDVDRQPSCQRPEVFDAFLGIAPAAREDVAAE